MIYKILIPVAIFSLMSITLITAVTQNNQVEYIDNYKDIPDSIISTNKSIQTIKNESQNLKDYTALRAKRYVQPAPKLTAEAQKKPVVAKNAKKKKNQKVKLANTKVFKKNKKTKKREPSQVKKDEAPNEHKFFVPNDLPPVNQPIFSTAGLLSNSQSNLVGAINPQAITASPSASSSAGTSSNIISDDIDSVIDTNQIPNSDPSILVSPEAKDALNNEYKNTFSALSNQLGQRVKLELQQAISSQANEDENLEIIEFKEFEVNFNDHAPGLNTFGRDSLILSLPQVGTWTMTQKVKVHYDNNIFETTEDITIKISHLSLNFPFKLIHNQSGQIYIYEALDPIYQYNISFESSSFLTNILFNLYSLFMPNYMNQAITLSVASLGMDVKNLVNKTKVPVQNINSVYTEAEPANFDQIIQNIDQKIQTRHMYNHTIHSLVMKTPASGAWKDNYTGSSILSGQIDKVNSIENSAKLSGQNLASLAFKYQVAPSSQNLSQIRNAIKGIENLFKVNGNTGLLARSVHKLDSSIAQNLISQNLTVGKEINIKSFDGSQWLGYQGLNGINRDQYSNVLFGLATTYEKVDDVLIKKKCQFLVKKMIKYLENHFWVFDKDRQSLTTAFEVDTPNIWQGSNHYKLAYYSVASKMVPGEYSEKLDQLSALTDTAWLTMYFETINPFHNYDRFHTYFTELYTYFLMDSDSLRRAQMEKVVRHLDFYLGHHRNAYFDTITSAILPGKLSNKISGMKVGLYKFLNRSNRMTRSNGIDMNSVVTVQTTLPSGEVVTMAKEALNPEYRDLTSENVWDKSAHHVETSDNENPLIENIGIDATLPYWMAKAHQFY